MIPDDLMGVHLKVQDEVAKKKEETEAAGKEHLPITNDMIVSSCIQVSSHITVSIKMKFWGQFHEKKVESKTPPRGNFAKLQRTVSSCF